MKCDNCLREIRIYTELGNLFGEPIHTDGPARWSCYASEADREKEVFMTNDEGRILNAEWSIRDYDDVQAQLLAIVTQVNWQLRMINREQVTA
jgi:hypothetical protein